MEERKIIDLTGNREEKIAPKTPGGNPDAEKPSGFAGGNGNRPRDDRHRNKNKKMNHKKRRDQERKIRQDDPAEEPRAAYAEESAEGKTEQEESSYVPAENASPADTEPRGEEPASEAPAEKPEEPAAEPVEIIGIRFRGAGKVYFFSPNGIAFAAGDHAIVETVRGMEFGDVTDGNRLVPASDIVQPLKPVLRKADEKDLAHFQNNCRLEEEAKPVFVEKVQKNKLEMQLVDVEYTFDNTKLCFYFTADGRVDFRELVKDLAAVFHTRIELRQIGPRDEARLCGGIDMCGRPVCCKLFLSDFAQVSIKMAKDQGLALASAKVNGLCGKLMCCVKFEQPVYEMESKRMPQPETEIDTPKGKAVVLESNFLSDTVKVKLVQDDSIKTYTMAELNGEDKPLKKDRKVKAGGEGFALRDSFASDWPEPDADTEPEKEPKKPKDNPPKTEKPPQGGKQNGGNPADRPKDKTPDQPPRKQNFHKGKNKRRFNRPGNIREKDSGQKKNG